MSDSKRTAGAPEGALATELKDGDELAVQRRIATITIVKREKKPAGPPPAAAPPGAAARGEEVGQGDPDDPDADDDEGDGMLDDVYDVSLSSEEPVDRWYGREILDHSADSIDLSRAKQGLPLLGNHDYRAPPAGRISNVKSDGKKTNGKMQFFDTPAGREWNTAVKGGHREMSIGYEVHAYDVTPAKADEPSVFRATKWGLLEGSMVSVPADATIGVGRSADRAKPVHVRHLSPSPPASGKTEITHMTEQAAPDTGKQGRVDAAEIILRAQKHGAKPEQA